MTYQPFVSIIIPTHNRRHILNQTIRALTQQLYPADKVELIIVADGCVDDTAHFVRTYAAAMLIHLIEQPGLGPARARNSGARQARGDVLLFIDDDIEATPHFIAAHVAHHKADEPHIVLGALPIAGSTDGSNFDQSIRQWWSDKFEALSNPEHRFQYGDLYTGNVSINAVLFKQLNGFNTDLWCHEDYEFGIRAAQAGALFHFSYAALAYHHDETKMQRSLHRRVAEGKADIYLARQYPKLRYQLPLSAPPFSIFCRLLRFAAFSHSSLGLLLVQLCLMGLKLLESKMFKTQWQALFYHVQDYFYWQGAAEAAYNAAEIQQLYEEAKTLDWDNFDSLMIDLNEDMAHIATQINKTRPDGLKICLNGQWIGELQPIFGAEKCQFSHVQSYLSTKQLGRLLIHLTLCQLPISNTQIQLNSNLGSTQFHELKYAVDSFYKSPKMIAELDILAGLSNFEIELKHDLYLLVKAGHKPLGWLSFLQLKTPLVTAESIKQKIEQQFGWVLVSEVWKRPFLKPWPQTTPPITAIVCTRNRPKQLKNCLNALCHQTHPDFAILIIDNAPSDNKTAELVAQFEKETPIPMTYIRENRPGLDWARNRGIGEAKTNLIAFTDDDARPDKNWLTAVAHQFKEPEIMAITGPALPAELITPFQNLFEFGYGGMSHGFNRRFLRRCGLKAKDLLWASGFGVGANMSFRKTVFENVGLFDEALDVGTPSNGGGDIDMFHRIVAHGGTLLYEPTAFVWHHHRQSEADLVKLMQNNGTGFGVYLLTCGRNGTVSWFTILIFWLRHWLWAWIIKRLIYPNGFPRFLIWHELKGGLLSIPTYFKAQKQKQRLQGIKSEGGQTAVSLIQSSKPIEQ